MSDPAFLPILCPTCGPGLARYTMTDDGEILCASCGESLAGPAPLVDGVAATWDRSTMTVVGIYAGVTVLVVALCLAAMAGWVP